ncbi:peptidoglycan/LPS O-acetylase OafA/YrhL [Bradyrhizobium huanghuaihaiense]|uniref:Peptidoglycan/LPS O-acetylase OafA/YrhL n=1 Tax=Bradyrhizobium huanghuaihaiense TaxID=990078 RepID=A0A562QVP0_9BRAD|nr:acyltransferase [Bradyrhizobium huanghuaihaiense]TWI60374.1 peptidoglycan/LPS O-acetylase OafA/YrhL [Bradyrhizobium huanghuaihaiense]
MSGDSKNFVEAIQGLRGVAALSVLSVHLQDMPLLAGFLPPIWPWLEATVNMGGHGVELFFMISGFLIPASLMRHRSVARFFLDRALRILPVFVILHLILFTAGPLVGYKFFKGIDLATYLKLFFVNLAFLPDALGLPIGQQNAWTLAYEWAFYILFAIIFVMAVQRRNWLLATPFILLGVAGIVFRPIAAFFLVGLLFSLIDWRIRIGGWRGVLAGIVCGAAMYVSIEHVHPLVGLLPGALLFGMVLAPDSGVAVALSGRFLQFLGKISYSLYLVHPFALFPLQVIGVKLAAHGVNLWLIWAAFAGLGLVASLIAGAVSYELIEVRLRRLLDPALRGLFFGVRREARYVA